MEGSPPPLQTKVVAVGNQKGGVGKTSNTVHLAAALAETGRKCLVWDLDVNCGSTQHFGIPDNMAILGTYEVLMGSEQPEEVIVREGDLDEVELPLNLNLLPARRNLEFIDQALVGKLGRFSDLGSVLKKPLMSLRGKYDYIFLDTAPNLTTPTIAAYKSADFFLLSAMPETFAVQGLNNALKDIQSVREHGGNPRLTLIGVVLSNVDGRLTRLARELLNYVDETFAQTPPWMRKYDTTISRTTVIPAAQKVGRTIFQTEPHHKVTEQFRALAREFEARMKMVEGQSAGLLTAQQVPQPGEAIRGTEPLEDVVNG
jgi:chromosome partitioning protein